jgi:hypothetical protein
MRRRLRALRDYASHAVRDYSTGDQEHPANLKLAIRVAQLKLPVTGRYLLVYQKCSVPACENEPVKMVFSASIVPRAPENSANLAQ